MSNEIYEFEITEVLKQKGIERIEKQPDTFAITLSDDHTVIRSTIYKSDFDKSSRSLRQACSSHIHDNRIVQEIILIISQKWNELISNNESNGYNVTECDRIQDTIKHVNFLSIDLQECLSGFKQEELISTNVQETNEHRLKIVKGMQNRELDTQLFEVSRVCNFLSDYLEKLYSEKEKRVKYGLIPIDGNDWEAADNGLPSIGPRIDAVETMEEM
jgi:hypothetical protein